MNGLDDQEADMKAVDTVERNPHYHCLEYDQDQIGDIYLVACGQEKCDAGITYGPDVRTCYHLHIVKAGQGLLKTGAGEFSVTEEQMFLLKHGETAEYTADTKTPWSYCWVTFYGSEARALVEEIGFTDGIYVLNNSLGAEPFYERILQMMEHPEMNAVSGLRRRGILMEFLAMAMEATGKQPALPRDPRPMEEYIRKAEDFIGYNYASIQVTDVIRYVGFTRSYFSTAFKKKTGLSVKDYLTKMRIDKAKTLLGATDLPVREIAGRVGYPDPLHFSRVFHDWCGESPTRYRTEMKNSVRGAKP